MIQKQSKRTERQIRIHGQDASQALHISQGHWSLKQVRAAGYEHPRGSNGRHFRVTGVIAYINNVMYEDRGGIFFWGRVTILLHLAITFDITHPPTHPGSFRSSDMQAIPIILRDAITSWQRQKVPIIAACGITPLGVTPRCGLGRCAKITGYYYPSYYGAISSTPRRHHPPVINI